MLSKGGLGGGEVFRLTLGLFDTTVLKTSALNQPVDEPVRAFDKTGRFSWKTITPNGKIKRQEERGWVGATITKEGARERKEEGGRSFRSRSVGRFTTCPADRQRA